MGNKYLEKIALKQGISVGKIGPTGSYSPGRLSNGLRNRGVKTLRMGPHTTPEDLLPNPQKMDIRIK